MKPIFENAKSYKLRRNAELKLKQAFSDLKLEFSWCCIISQNDGTFTPMIKLGETETVWIRVIAERGIAVTN